MATLCKGIPKWDSTGYPRLFIPTTQVDDSNMQCCIWDAGRFPSTIYGDCLCVPGTISLICLVYLIYFKDYFKLRRTTNEESYDVMYQFIWASLIRILMLGFANTLPIKSLCEDLAFLESIAVIFEIESLTHLCIDRYVCAKYIFNGWKFNKNHWMLYLILSAGFAMVYSLFPYYNAIGSFTYDFDCIHCAMDMILPKEISKRYQFLCVYFLKAIKPVIFMVATLFMAEKLQKKYTQEMEKRSQRYFTRVVTTIALTNVCCWAMWGHTRARVLLDQLLMGKIQVPFVSTLNMGLYLYTLSPVMTTLIIVHANYRLQGGQMTICRDIARYFLPTTPVSPKKDSAGIMIDVPGDDSPKLNDEELVVAEKDE